jgi:hypothetical protein
MYVLLTFSVAAAALLNANGLGAAGMPLIADASAHRRDRSVAFGIVELLCKTPLKHDRNVPGRDK